MANDPLVAGGEASPQSPADDPVTALFKNKFMSPEQHEYFRTISKVMVSLPTLEPTAA